MNKGYSDYIFLLPGKQFSGDFLNSLIGTINYLNNNNHSYYIITGYSPIITSVRNGLFSNFSLDSMNGKEPALNSLPVKIFNDQVFCKRLIMIDSDIIWNINDIKKLIYAKEDILCGTYLLGDGINSSVKRYTDKPFYTAKELKNEKEIFEADSSGLGFVSINFNAIKDIEYPWFVVEENVVEVDGKKYQKTVGEDVYFFNKLKNAGYKIHVDPSIKLKHEKNKYITLEQ